MLSRSKLPFFKLANHVLAVDSPNTSSQFVEQPFGLDENKRIADVENNYFYRKVDNTLLSIVNVGQKQANTTNNAITITYVKNNQIELMMFLVINVMSFPYSF